MFDYPIYELFGQIGVSVELSQLLLPLRCSSQPSWLRLPIALESQAVFFLAETAKLKRVVFARCADIIDDKVVVSDKMSLVSVVSEVAYIFYQLPFVRDEHVIKGYDSLMRVASRRVLLQPNESGLVQFSLRPFDLSDETVEAGLVGGRSKLGVDAGDSLTLSDHQTGEILSKVTALRLVGKKVGEFFESLFNDSWILNYCRHKTLRNFLWCVRASFYRVLLGILHDFAILQKFSPNYKRFNFQSVPMEDYEINDVRSRQRTLAPLINIDIEAKRGNLVYLIVTNIGKVPAQDVTFVFSKEINWRGSRGTPTLFKRGIKYFPPGRTFNFFYNSFIGAFDKESEIPSSFEIEVSYLHPDISQRITDTFYVDLMDYMDTYVVESEIVDLSKKVQEGFKELKNEINKTNNHLSILSSISGATGLDLSIPTLKNIGHILKDDGKIERIDPNGLRADAFKELLGVNDNLAYELQCHFMSIGRVRLEEIEGMTEELIQEFKKHFFTDDREDT